MSTSVGNFPRRERWSIHSSRMPVISGEEWLFLVWPLGSPLLGKLTLGAIPSASGKESFWRRGLGWLGGGTTSSELPLFDLSKDSQPSRWSQHLHLHGWLHRVFNLLVGSEELQTKQKLWMRHNSTFRKQEDAVAGDTAIGKVWAPPIIFPSAWCYNMFCSSLNESFHLVINIFTVFFLPPYIFVQKIKTQSQRQWVKCLFCKEYICKPKRDDYRVKWES